MDRYQRHYGVGFLDDLHNFFPDLLYRQGQLSREFQYIRDQTRYLFTERYAQGSFEYARSPANMNTIQYIIAMLQPSNQLETFLALFDEMEPVVVRPTAEQITRATSIIPHIEVDTATVCTICQDHACPDETMDWRMIESCRHLYHKKCIDRWFETSVYCPVCRIDIRPA